MQVGKAVVTYKLTHAHIYSQCTNMHALLTRAHSAHLHMHGHTCAHITYAHTAQAHTRLHMDTYAHTLHVDTCTLPMVETSF